MRRPGGYLAVSNPDGSRTESDSFTCSHCNRVVFVKPKAAAADCGGMCKRCMGLTCPRCTALGRCTPFEKKLERYERRAKLLEAVTGSR